MSWKIVFAAIVGASTLVADEKVEWKSLKGTWNVEKAVLMGQYQTETFKSLLLTMD